MSRKRDKYRKTTGVPVELQEVLGMLPEELQAQLGNLPPEQLQQILDELMASEGSDPTLMNQSEGSFSVFLTPKAGLSPLPSENSFAALGISSPGNTKVPTGTKGSQERLSKRHR